MTEIRVTPQSDAHKVEVTEGSSSTSHLVRVPDEFLAKLGLEGVDRERVIEESFRFLLEREPKESILRSFELATISRYFPEYPEEIKRRLG